MNKCSKKDSLKMILIWITLLLLHQGHALVPVITAHPGEATTLTCVLPDIKDSRSKLFWYRQNSGDNLEVVVRFVNHQSAEYGPGYSDSRVKPVLNDKMSNLTILKAVQEDEGMYHCSFTDWSRNVWQGTYLLIKGNTVGTSNYKVIQRTMISDLVHPEDSVTLQCSILSDFENNTCLEDLSVFWFRSTNSHPNIIYTDGDKTKCQKKHNYQTRCVFNFSVSASDAGTYYCAVATCGEILVGNGAKLKAEPKADPAFPFLVVAMSCLILSVIINAVFICRRTPTAACKPFKEKDSTSSPERSRSLNQRGDHSNENEQDRNYAALHFSGGKATRGIKRNETKECVFPK